VVITPGDNSPSEEEVIDICKVQLGSYKRPGRVVLQENPLPRTPVGKIQRKAVREIFWEKDSGRNISGA